MEEIKEQSCSTNSKKCCVKGIAIVVICSLICFFLGYYFGSKTNNRASVSRPTSSSGMNRPINTRIPRNIPNIPRIYNPTRIPKTAAQRQPNIPPQYQRPRVNPTPNVQGTQTRTQGTTNTQRAQRRQATQTRTNAAPKK